MNFPFFSFLTVLLPPPCCHVRLLVVTRSVPNPCPSSNHSPSPTLPILPLPWCTLVGPFPVHSDEWSPEPTVRFGLQEGSLFRDTFPMVSQKTINVSSSVSLPGHGSPLPCSDVYPSVLLPSPPPPLRPLWTDYPEPP